MINPSYLRVRCYGCGKRHLREEFSENDLTGRRKRLVCKRYKKEMRKRRYLRKYGITSQQYNETVEDQHGCCAICLLHRPLVIDHCHTNGHARGLLCNQCNTTLGLMADSPMRLRNAADYLERTAKPKRRQRPAPDYYIET